MVCSHYEVYVYDLNRNVLAYATAYSFDEAYYYIDKVRERYPFTAVEFCIKYPPDEIVKKEGEQHQLNDSSHPFADDVLMEGD